MDKLDIKPVHGSTDTELLFSVQVIDKQRLDQSTQTQMLQEVKLMKLVQHPNVVRLYEVRFCSSHSSNIGQDMDCMSKKFWPILYSKLTYKLGLDFLDGQYYIYF